MNKLAILGAGGHGSVVYEIAINSGWDVVDIFDDNPYANSDRVIPTVIGNTDSLKNRIDSYDGYHVAIGDNYKRRVKIDILGFPKLVSLIHPSAVVSSSSTIGSGCAIMAGVIVNGGGNIGVGCILNTGCAIDHDCTVNDFAHIGPGSKLAGGVSVGSCALIGVGACIIPNLKIGSESTVGAGSVVVKNVAPDDIVYGNPARKAKSI